MPDTFMNNSDINNRFSEDRKQSCEFDSDHHFSLKKIFFFLEKMSLLQRYCQI